MSKLIDLNLSPDERTLRQFGWIALAGFGFLAVLAWQEWLIFAFGLGAWRGTVAGVFAGLGVAAALTSLVYPKANWGLYVGMTLVAYPIGFRLVVCDHGLALLRYAGACRAILPIDGSRPFEAAL